MTELADPDVSELHSMANKKSKEVRECLERYEKWRGMISENMSEHMEFARVTEEIAEAEMLINEEDQGGRGSLKDLQAELETEKQLQAGKKEDMGEFQSLLTAAKEIQNAAERVWEKMGNVKEKREQIKYQFCGTIDDPRDLTTVEKDLTKCSDKKEEAYNSINKLNNEQKQLNEKISRVTNQAAAAE